MLADVSYYSAPCESDANLVLGALPKCGVAAATGGAAASQCGDGKCWLEVTVDGVAAWVPDRACGAAAPGALGEAGALCTV